MADDSKDISMLRNPADKLTEDLLVEILSRVPYRSLCRFKCVSKRWRGIISQPDHRKALPQFHLHDLAGFFYSRRSPGPDYFFIRHFTHVSAGGRTPMDPSLPFLPNCDHFHLLDSCNGLLLCRRFETADSRAFDYVVCNPATEKWVALPLPPISSKWQTAHLGFDPSVSSHFHVFQFLEDGADTDDDDSDDDVDDIDGHVKGVEIYSSKTGAWSHKDSDWGFPARITSISAFGNGFLHLVDIWSAVVVAVDVEGTTWRVIPMPSNLLGSTIDLAVGFTESQSQGRLYFANIDHLDCDKLLIWVLEDYDSEVWVLKHSVSPFDLFGAKYVHQGIMFHIAAHHPQRNMIFLVYGHDKELMSYEMDSGEVQFIRVLGNGSMGPYLPYVPLYSEELADWN